MVAKKHISSMYIISFIDALSSESTITPPRSLDALTFYLTCPWAGVDSTLLCRACCHLVWTRLVRLERRSTDGRWREGGYIRDDVTKHISGGKHRSQMGQRSLYIGRFLPRHR